jgi:hypothetical protein
MSRALKTIVERLGAHAGVLCCAVILDLPYRLPKADGLDAAGRSVVLIGRYFLGQDAAADVAVEYILGQLKRGHYHDAVHPVLFAPRASAAIAAAVDDGPIEEILCHGPRGTGKTHALAAAALINAELHVRAGYPGPFKVAWLHDSLKSASAKLGEALELPMWGGLWSIKDDRTKAIFSLGGQELVRGEFVGCRDESSSERLRQDAHMVLAEELIASLSDGLGIEEPQWRLARSSAIRLPTRRRSSMAATNPGSPDLWPAVYFGVVGSRHPNRLAIQIPCDDRMTPEQRAEHDRTFAGTSAMDQRLGEGLWIMAEPGQPVAEGFDATIHVTASPLNPQPQYLMAIGWDGGHSPTAIIGQNLNGQIQIFAALNGLHIGTLELIEQQVLPWLQTHTPWALSHSGALLVHVVDPNMATPGQASIFESAEKVIETRLGGRVIHGAVRWPPRHERGKPPLQIAPGSDTELLVQSLAGRWIYPQTADGRVDGSGPKKPNSPWADVGDAFAYLAGWLLGGESMEISYEPIRVDSSFSLDHPYYQSDAGMERPWLAE